jgi:hypothetical protein
MSSEHNQPVFTYHTRVSVTPEQDQMLRGYTSLFGRVERTLYADMQKGKDASELKSAYLARFEITARQFNAVRIQLQGKVKAMREQLPGLIDNLKTRIRKAKKTIAKLAKLIPGSEKLHQKRRRLEICNRVLKNCKTTENQGGLISASARRSYFALSFISRKTAANRTTSGTEPSRKRDRSSSSYWARRTRQPAARAASLSVMRRAGTCCG